MHAYVSVTIMLNSCGPSMAMMAFYELVKKQTSGGILKSSGRVMH